MKKQHYFPILIVIYIIVLNATYASCQIIDSLKHRITTEINDSVKVELLNYIARDYKDYYPDSLNIALSYAKQALQLAKKTNNPKGQYDALNYIGNFYLDLNNRKQCVKAYERGMTIADSIGNKRKKLQLKGNLATAYTQWNEFEKAIKMKYENIEAFEELNDSTALMIEWYGIAHIKFNNRNAKDAIPMYYKALRFGTHPVITANLGQAYSMVNQYDSAFYYLNLAIDQVPKGSYNETDFLEILGVIYIEEKQYKEGIDRLERALENYGSDINIPNAIDVKLSLVNAYAANKQLGKANATYNLITKSVIDNLPLSNNAKYWRTSYQLHEKNGDFYNAFIAHKKFISFRDSLDNNELRSELKKIEAKFETVKKEEAIKSLETQKEIDAIKLKNTNRILWITSAVLFTLLGLLFFIFKLYNQGKIKNDIISSTLSDKELLLKEIHHRVKNNLQVVSSLLSLQSEYIKDDAALSAKNEGRSRVRSMALIHQNLYSEGNLTGINVKSYLEKLISGLFETYNISEDEITLDIDIENVELDVDIVIPLGLIANELVSNALKHAFVDQKDGNIKVSLITAKNSLTFEVQDNGIGVDTTLDIEEMESFGYQMIFAFKEKLEAELKIENESGTKVSLHIDNFQKLNNDS